MGKSLLRRIVELAPSNLRRSALGAVADLKSIPARIRDPKRRAEPLHMIHHVGEGDYRAQGEHVRWLLQAYGDLSPTDQVLDIGSGNGRAAEPLAELLAPGGGAYVGFDVSKLAIRMCQRRFRDQPAVRFVHLDVWNGDYNPSGKVAEADTRFPAEDGTIDLAFATSVFTHMQYGAVSHYLREAARVLKPGGRIVFTAYTVEDGRDGPGRYAFVPFDATSQAVDPEAPERAIAHRKAAIEAALEDAGLAVRSFHQGQWRPPATYDGGQDLWVAVRP
jgi:SAM-dependent methyltransferase